MVFRATLPVARDGGWEPLLAVGAPGAGDVVFCRRIADGRWVFGWEQLGRPAAISEPAGGFGSDPVEILISLGSLCPAEGDPLYEKDSSLTMLRDIALVQCRGRTVLLAKGEFQRSKSIGEIGRNRVGGSFARPNFSGKIGPPLAADWSAAFAALVAPGSLIAEEQGASHDAPEYPGPLKLKLSFPGGGGGHNEPLVVTGETGAGDLVYVRYEDDRHLRIGFDHWRVGGPLTEPLVCDIAVPHEVVVSLGSLFPPLVAGERDAPEIAALRDRCVVLLDGKVVIAFKSAFYPTTVKQLTLFTNQIGGSTANPVFTGTITRVERVSPEEILRALPPHPSGTAR